MSTGNKTVRSRQNARSRAANRPERRGGARPNSGPVKKRAIAREDLRALMIERFEATNADPNEMGKHWIDGWIEVLRDEQFRSSNAGGKLVSDLFHFIFNEPPAGKHGFLPPSNHEGGNDISSGKPQLPPLRPDPARMVPFKPDDGKT